MLNIQPHNPTPIVTFVYYLKFLFWDGFTTDDGQLFGRQKRHEKMKGYWNEHMQDATIIVRCNVQKHSPFSYKPDNRNDFISRRNFATSRSKKSIVMVAFFRLLLLQQIRIPLSCFAPLHPHEVIKSNYFLGYSIYYPVGYIGEATLLLVITNNESLQGQIRNVMSHSKKNMTRFCHFWRFLMSCLLMLLMGIKRKVFCNVRSHSKKNMTFDKRNVRSQPKKNMTLRLPHFTLQQNTKPSVMWRRPP